MKQTYDALNLQLAEAGFSKVVYSLVMPETEAIIDAIMEPSRRDEFRARYRDAWTHKQDTMDQVFFETWKSWSAPIVSADWSQFPFSYPTAGASEGLRAAIETYGSRMRLSQREPVIHIFEGEYEGFPAYARAAGIEVVVHDRSEWRRSLPMVGEQHQFYISQPSAIDGMVWDDFDAFVTAVGKARPSAEVMLDLTYVGCVAREFRVKADHPNIAAVFFSLSKPAGVYYHRIGGLLSRDAYDSLYGNMWFKNLMAIQIGTELMQRHGVHELPRRYHAQQVDAAKRASETLGPDFAPADVFILATANLSTIPSDMEAYLTRPAGRGGIVRVCLTPTMAQMIGTASLKETTA
jgi:hypothetical protein